MERRLCRWYVCTRKKGGDCIGPTKRGKGCKVVLWFRNACGALATGTNYGYGFAWAANRSEAEQVALKYCQKYTDSCKIAVWTCTTR